jgi:hypothetical protein
MNEEKFTSIAIEPKTHAILKRIKKEKRKNNINEVIALLIAEHEFLEREKQNIAPKEQEDDSIKCINRILHNGFYWCVHKPPKMIKLETLNICKVCKARRIGLTDSTKIEQEVKDAKDRAWLRDRNKDMTRYNMTFCERDGLWVFQYKCKECRNPCDKAPETNPFLPLSLREKKKMERAET